MKKYELGNVYSIKFKDGYSYFQYTHFEDTHGYLLKVFKGRFKKKLTREQITDLVQKPELFYTFTHLRYIVRKEDNVEIVGHFPIPDQYKGHPIMRSPMGRSRKDGKELS